MSIQEKIHLLAPRLSKLKAKPTESELQSYVQQLGFGLTEIAKNIARIAPFDSHLFDNETLMQIHKLTQNPEQLQQVAIDSLLVITKKKLAEVVGLSDQAVRALFRIGAEIYNEGRYYESGCIFLVVCLLDGSIHDAWISLGHAECRNKEFERAVIAYEMATQCEQANPISRLYLAHCFEALGEIDNAIDALNAVIMLAETFHEHHELLQKAKACKSRLKGERS